MAGDALPENQALTPEEVAELDGFGPLSGRQMLPERAMELWEREIMWGRVEGGHYKGLLA